MIKIGQKLQEERLRKNLKLKEISDATKIKEEFLDAIEKGEYDRLPSPSYARGFVGNYAKFLELDENESLALFRREFDQEKAYSVLPKGLSNESEFTPSKFKLNRGIVLAGITFSALIFFLFFQYRAAIFNPPLKIESPREGEVFENLNVSISGKTDPNATIFVDERQIPVEADGSFNANMTFFPGENTLTIRATNRFGKESEAKRQINIKP